MNFPVSNSYILGKIFGEENIVSATPTLNCCSRKTSGAICQDLASTDSASCAVSLLPIRCQDSADCIAGCCIDESEGLCSTQSPKKACEDGGGTWDSNAQCLISECQRGCCVLGNNAQFVPEKRCEVLSLVQGFAKDFRNLNTELECLLVVANSSTESCVGNDCNVSQRRDCVDEQGKTRKDGESWCSYDGFIGEGKDTVGSRHWKQSCVDSEVVNEGCSDYRGGICVQSVIEEGSQSFSMASCIMNTALQCLKYNEDDDMTTKCQEDKSCMINNIDVDTGFKFDVCVGRYPRGLDLTDNSGVDDKLCSMADQTCVVTLKKGFFSGYKCEDNCNCEKEKFAEEMNDFCVSLGDCGSYVNYIGKGTDNIRVTNSPKISWTKYSSYANVVAGQFAEPPDISAYLSSIGGNAENFDITEESDFSLGVQLLGRIVGGAGSIIQGAGILFGSAGKAAAISKAGGTAAEIASAKAGLLGAEGSNALVGTQLGAFAGAAGGAALGAMAGYYIAKALGLGSEATAVMAIAGGVAGAVVGYYVTIGVSIPIIGWIIILVAVIVMAIIALSGWGKVKQVNVEFTCMPWQAPVGGSDCEICNDDDSKPCSEYRCSSLGQACKLLNADEENPVCQSIAYEPNSPVISKGYVLTSGYKFLNEQAKRIEIRKNSGECVQEFTPVIFTLETNEFAQCKYSFARTSTFEEMNEYGLEQTTFVENHTFGFSMPSIDSFSVYNVSGDLKEMFWNMNMYVRCQDYHGNFNIDEYVVNFCVNSGPDTTAVSHALTVTDPANGAFLKYGTTQQNMKMWINEPAECKYDIVAGKTYDAMANSMLCKTDLLEAEANGWPCNTTLSVSNGTNNFYIKCKDKPWVLTAENVSKYGARNINVEDFVYVLKVVENPLVINSVTPQGNLESGFEPISVELEVKTSGGVENGKSECSYEWGGNFVQFLNTFSNTHTQPGLSLMHGSFNIPIKCEDTAGNVALNNSVFNIAVDSEPPIAVRVFYEGGNLKLITNEDAKCYYNLTSCDFNLENANSMGSSFSVEHSANWIVGQTYYIKCKDIWNNENPTCAIKAEPSG